jgi:hypothetical protein
MAIAAPLRAEWSPISFSVNPRMSGPSDAVASRSRLSNSGPVK